MEECPYLSSIQAIPGRTPPEKYRELHRIASTIASNEEERVAFVGSGVTERVQSPLLPLLRILVGDRLKLANFVAEALQSDDVSVIKRAFNATWFFEAANLDVDLILDQVVPKAAPRTRAELVKVLAKSLRRSDDAPEKAEALFERLSDSYGVELAQPLLPACGNEFIYRVVIERRIKIPSRLLLQLYRGGRSEAVLKYLWLGVENDPENRQDRRTHNIYLGEYMEFIPVLVKHHLKEFLKLYECMFEDGLPHSVKLGHERAESFLQNASETLIEKPTIFLNILPLKLVSHKLTKEQFMSMYLNLFPNDRKMCDLTVMIGYLRFQPQHTKMQMFISAYEQKYTTPFSFKKCNYHHMWILRSLLSSDEKETWARNVLKDIEDKQRYYDSVHFLPPSESISVLKERVKRLSDPGSRSRCIQDMIESCAFYDSKNDLIKVLKYYEGRHKNEQYNVLPSVFQTISNCFHLDKLEEDHWRLLLGLASRAHIKNEIVKADIFVYINLFQRAVNFYLKKLDSSCTKAEEEVALTELMDKILDICLDNVYVLAPAEAVDPENKRNYLTRLLKMIDQKYPEGHAMWELDRRKYNISLCLLNAMNDINAHKPSKKPRRRVRRKRRNPHKFEKKIEVEPLKMTIHDYPWLKKLVVDLIKTDDSSLHNLEFTRMKAKRRRMQVETKTDRLRMALRIHDLELYESLIDDILSASYDIDLGDAWLMFKRSPNKIWDKWYLYLDICRQKLSRRGKCSQNFVRSCKWFQDLPLNFVKQSLINIEEPGSVLVLGLLLDGETFSKITSQYRPSDDRTSLSVAEAKKMHGFNSSLIRAMNYTNPTVPLDTTLPFCKGEYLSAITTIVPGLVRRTPTDKIVAFADQLMKKTKTISMKKLGIHLIYQTLSVTESKLFLENIFKTESNPSIRELTAKMIFHIFTKFPTLHTWELITIVIKNLNKDDDALFQILIRIDRVDKDFIPLYIRDLLNKVESSLNENEASGFIHSIVLGLKFIKDRNVINRIPERILKSLVENVFPGNQSFLIETYAFSDPHQFQSRFNLLTELLRNKMQKVDEPDSRLMRHYPANYMIRQFFDGVIRVLVKSEQKQMSLRFVDGILQFFSSVMEPYLDLQSYISFKFLKNLLENENLADFADELYITSMGIITDFGSEYVIRDIGMVLGQLIFNTCDNKRSSIDASNMKLEITKYLMAKHEKIGSLIGFELLKAHEISKYNDEYDKLVQIWTNSQDITVKAAFHGFINTIERCRT